jgi:hypothetical protein
LLLFSVKLLPLKNGIEPVCHVVVPVPPFPTPSVPPKLPSVRQLPLIAKQPAARLMPPVVENDEVAVEKLMPLVLPTERSEPGLLVPMPTLPEEAISNFSVFPPSENTSTRSAVLPPLAPLEFGSVQFQTLHMSEMRRRCCCFRCPENN